MRLQRRATANINPLVVLMLGFAVCLNGIPLARGVSRKPSTADRSTPASAVKPKVESPKVDEKRKLRGKSTDPKTVTRLNENYGRIPMSFESNQGQADSKIEFISRGRGYGLFLTADQAFLLLGNKQRGATVRMKLANANRNPRVIGVDELPGKSNYYLGTDPTKWQTNVPNYGKVIQLKNVDTDRVFRLPLWEEQLPLDPN